MQRMTDTIPDFADLFSKRRIAVAGDVMLDRFIHGAVKRISPEAPIPVLLKRDERIMLGGAGNVARNIVALGGTAILIGAVGDDMAGRELKAQIAREPHIEDDTMVIAGAVTTEKIRYVSQQQLLRVDFEQGPGAQALDALDAGLVQRLADYDLLVLSDYAKGALSRVEPMIQAARAIGMPVLVDPKGHRYLRYRGASLVTPNRNEMQDAVGRWDS